ncbi:DUF262 domain-containing protein [Heliobacterium mobile]|nr:DUF262 domain-containing protein [Heliobacterium mobile]
MIALQASIREFIQKEDQQFVIPVYQRTYDWKKPQCMELLKDIKKAGENITVKSHFLGSIVYIMDNHFHATGVKKLLVIDGQQRITTISLLVLAMAEYLGQTEQSFAVSKKELLNRYIYNQYSKQPETDIKLQLTKSDKHVYENLVRHGEVENKSHNIIKNYLYFMDYLLSENPNIDHLNYGLSKLLVVDVSLVRGEDNPQLIFESMNSTGLNLTQADLIRNYILMDMEPEPQTLTYEKYWYPMEQKLKNNIPETDTIKNELSDFLRDYLILKSMRIPRKSSVYDDFKKFYESKYTRSKDDINSLMSDLFTYSKIYNIITKGKDENKEISNKFLSLNKLDINVAYPLLMKLHCDYTNGYLNKSEITYLLDLIESYVLRRLICNLPTNSLNKVFLSIIKEIDETNYVRTLEKILLDKNGSARFPDDIEFKEAFILRDIYNMNNKNRKYILSKLENHNSKELLNVDEFTIEHIMPQTKDLSIEWKMSLGDEWRHVHGKYLHTIGNLTLTGYNSEMGKKSFIEKRDMEKGFRDSPVRLNDSLKNLTTWNEAEILKRANLLADLALQIWFRPYYSKSNEEYISKFIGFSDDWTGKKPVSFVFMDNDYKVRDLTNLYTKLISLLYEFDMSNFLSVIEDEDFQNRKFCSKRPEELNYPYEVSDSGIYIEKNLNSNAKKKNLELLFEKLEIDENDLIINF